jgi:hypothetical protein
LLNSIIAAAKSSQAWSVLVFLWAKAKLHAFIFPLSNKSWICFAKGFTSVCANSKPSWLTELLENQIHKGLPPPSCQYVLLGCISYYKNNKLKTPNQGGSF